MPDLTGAGLSRHHSTSSRQDLRDRVAAAILERLALVAADTAADFPNTGTEELEPGYFTRLAEVVLQLLAFAVRDGGLDARGGSVGDLRRTAVERTLSTARLFTMTYRVERTCLDDLATDESLGATTESWPLAAQLVRRASFDLLAAYAERAQAETAGAAVVDRLTTLYTRPVFDAVLTKAIERSTRFGDRLSLILFDVNHLAAINEAHGYGVGDRILERLGILVRGYFRQYDWVARHSDNGIAVLLTQTEPDAASELAERVCSTVLERFEFVDHLTNQAVQISLAAAVVNVSGSPGIVIDSERLMAHAEAAVDRAKGAGAGRVQRVDGYPACR